MAEQKRDYYEVLGVDKNATDDAIKKAYRKLAKNYHCQFLAASDVAAPSEWDQEHLDEKGHKALAEEIYKMI